MVQLLSFLRSIQNLRLTSFYWSRDYCTSPWTVQFLDGTNIQYLLDMGPHMSSYMRGGIHAGNVSSKGV